MRRGLVAVWLLVVVLAGSAWALDPDRYGPGAFRLFLETHRDVAFGAFAIPTLLRGFFLLHSTPFVLTGALLFPDHPFAVFGTSMVGIWIASTIAYLFPEWLGLDATLEGRNAKLYPRLHDAMDRWGIWAVAIWAFLPFTPTDLVCCAAGLTRMRFSRFLLGISLGEIPLVTAYVLTGKRLFGG